MMKIDLSFILISTITGKIMKKCLFLFLCFITYYIGAIPPKFWEQIQLINLTPNTIEYIAMDSEGEVKSGESIMFGKQELSYSGERARFTSHTLFLSHVNQSDLDVIDIPGLNNYTGLQQLFFNYHYDIFMGPMNRVRDFRIYGWSSGDSSNVIHTDMYTVLIDYSFLSPPPTLCSMPRLIDLSTMENGPPELRVAFFNKHVNNHGDNIIRVRIIIMPRVIIPNLDESGSRICGLYNCFFKFNKYINK